MDEDATQDLKQFISATIVQQVAEVRSDIRALDGKLSSKIDDLSKSVAEALIPAMRLQRRNYVSTNVELYGLNGKLHSTQ